jgi:acetyl esterase
VAAEQQPLPQPDRQTRTLLDMVARRRAPRHRDLPAHEARAMYEQQALVLDIEPMALPQVEDLLLPLAHAQIGARLYYGALPNAWQRLPCLLFFHGGGFTIGSIDTHDALCRKLAADAQCAVLSVNYRLAPEHKFPAAADDAFGAFDWLRAHCGELGIDPARIAIGGDSAGGTLATVTAIRARDLAQPLVLQLLIYPGVGGHQSSASHRRLAFGYLLEKPDLDWFFTCYLRTEKDRNDWRFAPLDAPDAPSLAGVAPVWLAGAEFDPLIDDNLAYAAKLRAAGVPVDLRLYRGTIHGFMQFGALIDTAVKAIDDAAAALRQVFQKP